MPIIPALEKQRQGSQAFIVRSRSARARMRHCLKQKTIKENMSQMKSLDCPSFVEIYFTE